MKKKCFNDKYGQTESVLNGTKTMFREVYKCPATWNGIWVSGYIISRNKIGDMFTYLVDEDEREIAGSYIKPKYRIGEVIAVAQSYSIINEQQDFEHKFVSYSYAMSSKLGWTNKLLVKASLMPHQIKITGIKLERLQDISDEDCIKEGIIPSPNNEGKSCDCWYLSESGKGYEMIYYSPKEAFGHLINEVTKKGTWEQNPYVIAYEFELTK